MRVLPIPITDVVLQHESSTVDRRRHEEQHAIKLFVNRSSTGNDAHGEGLESGNVCQALELDGEVEVSRMKLRHY